MLDKEQTKQLAKTITLIPTADIEGIKNAAEQSDLTELIRQLVASHFHSLFVYQPEDSAEDLQARTLDVRSQLGTLKSRQNIRDNVIAIQAAFEKVDARVAIASTAFWTQYLQLLQQANATREEDFLESLREEFGAVGFVLDRVAAELYRALTGGSATPEHITQLVEATGIVVVPEMPKQTLTKLLSTGEKNLYALLSPNVAQANTATFSITGKPTNTSLPAIDANSVHAAIDYYDKRGGACQTQRDAAQSFQSFLTSNKLNAQTGFASAILTHTANLKTQHSTESPVRKSLEDLGLSANAVDIALGRAAAAAPQPTPQAQTPPPANSSGLSYDQIDESNWGDVRYLGEQNRIQEAHNLIEQKRQQGTQILTLRYKDLIAQIGKKYKDMLKQAQDSIKLAKEWKFDACNDGYQKLKKLDPKFAALKAIEDVYAEEFEKRNAFRAQKKSASQAKSNEVLTQLNSFNLPKAKAALREAKELDPNNPNLESAASAINAAEQDKYWGFKPNQPGARLNPQIDPFVAVKDTTWWIKLLSMVAAGVVNVILDVLTAIIYTFGNDDSAAYMWALFAAGSGMIWFGIILFWVTTLIWKRMNPGLIRWIAVYIPGIFGFMFTFAGLAQPLSYDRGSLRLFCFYMLIAGAFSLYPFLHQRKQNQKRSGIFTTYELLAQRSATLKEQGPSAELFTKELSA